MEQILFGDLFYNHIVNYLNPATLYNLCQTTKSYRKNITKPHFEIATIREIKKRLRRINKGNYKVCDCEGIIAVSGLQINILLIKSIV